MKSLTRLAFSTACLLTAGLAASGPANAQLHVGISLPGVHIGVGTPDFYYRTGFYPPGPCDAYDSYYSGDCGYAVYTGPIFIDGVNVGGPHYYRWYDGRPYFWYRGGWHFWGGWQRVNFSWNRGEGYGWHDGHWDRGWGDAHWHGEPDRFRDRDDHFGDRDDHFRDRDDHFGDRSARGGNDRGEHRGERRNGH